MKSSCKFCRKFGGAIGRDAVTDHVLFESENFVVIPTVGSIVPGWLLVVPRSHYLCIGALDNNLTAEFLRIQDVAASALRECFGPVSLFEHGAVRECESVGCGVDHAHMHVVPTNFDLLTFAKSSTTTSLQWREVAGIEAAKGFLAEGRPYVFFQSSAERSWIGSADKIESQLMRKAVACLRGKPNQWDWKMHGFEENIAETVSKIETWKAARSGILRAA